MILEGQTLPETQMLTVLGIFNQDGDDFCHKILYRLGVVRSEVSFAHGNQAIIGCPFIRRQACLEDFAEVLI